MVSNLPPVMIVSAEPSCCVPGLVDERALIVAQPATKPRAEDCKNNRREKSVIQQPPSPAPPGADSRRSAALVLATPYITTQIDGYLRRA